MPLTLDPPLDYVPRLPRRRDVPIGVLGAGFIVRDCHLVAYRTAGFNPVAIASRTPATAAEVAARHGIPRVYPTYSELLADPAIEVLDLAVPPDVQPGLILEAVARGAGRLRGILAQKPLAMSVAEARRCVDRCAAAGVVLVVNQNMRYDQSVRAARDVLRRGLLGQPVLTTIELRAVPHWAPWSEHLPSLSTYIMSVHHLDTFRFWLGTPDRVLASTRPDPRTRFPHADGINLSILEYDSGARASAWDDVWAGPVREGIGGETFVRWRIEGTEGIAQGTIGWPRYPEHTPSTIDVASLKLGSPPGEWHRPRWPEAWFPDAFAGPMAELLVALEDGTVPELSGRDNLETVALCAAVVAAAADHRVTTVREFLGGPG